MRVRAKGLVEGMISREWTISLSVFTYPADNGLVNDTWAKNEGGIVTSRDNVTPIVHLIGTPLRPGPPFAKASNRVSLWYSCAFRVKQWMLGEQWLKVGNPFLMHINNVHDPCIILFAPLAPPSQAHSTVEISYHT